MISQAASDAHGLLDKTSRLLDRPDEETERIGHSSLRILKKFRAPLTAYDEKLTIDYHKKPNPFTYDPIANMDFYLKVYLPRREVMLAQPRNSTRKVVKRVVVMFNGLDEIEEEHFSLYDRMGSTFNSLGISAVLLPTPFHLNRAAHLLDENDKRRLYRPKDNGRKRVGKALIKTPSARLIDNKYQKAFLLPLNFAQTLYEFAVLVNLMKCEFNKVATKRAVVNGKQFILNVKGPNRLDRNFYRRYFDCDELEISVLGYSLGGLRAMACLTAYPTSVTRCLLLGSGGPINSLNLNPIVTRTTWAQMISRISPIGKEYNPQASPEGREFGRSPHVGTINNVLFSQDEEVIESKRAIDVMVVAGADDKIVTPDSLQRLNAEHHRVSVIQVGDMSHFLASDPEFYKWYSNIMAILGDFLVKDNHEIVSARDSLKAILKVDKDLSNVLTRTAANDTKPLDRIVQLEAGRLRLTKSAKKEAIQEFFKLYRITKAYYRSDEKVIEAVLDMKSKKGLYFGMIAGAQEEVDEAKVAEAMLAKRRNEMTGQALVRSEVLDQKRVQELLSIQNRRYEKLSMCPVVQEIYDNLHRCWATKRDSPG